MAQRAEQIHGTPRRENRIIHHWIHVQIVSHGRHLVLLKIQTTDLIYYNFHARWDAISGAEINTD